MRGSAPMLLLLLLMPTGQLKAADARIGVHAKHGEMVLLRNVDARPAYRPAPPGIALIVDPTPNREIEAVQQTAELGDADFAALIGGATARNGEVTQGIAPMLGVATDGNSQTRVDAGGVSGMGALSSPLGAVGGVTGGVGASVRGALSQLPFGAKPGGGP